jgi:hypothetical protein
MSGTMPALDRRDKRDHADLWTARVHVDARARIEWICYEPHRKAYPMNGRNLLLVALGLVVVGVLAVWFVKVLAYLIIGGLLVGGALYLYAKARRTLDDR